MSKIRQQHPNIYHQPSIKSERTSTTKRHPNQKKRLGGTQPPPPKIQTRKRQLGNKKYTQQPTTDPTTCDKTTAYKMLTPPPITTYSTHRHWPNHTNYTIHRQCRIRNPHQDRDRVDEESNASNEEANNNSAARPDH